MRSAIHTIAGRRVVLKPLDADCLLDGELHPSIAARLQRVQQLPMTQVANLHGVQRDGDDVFMVWDFVEGKALAEMSDRGGGALEREVRHVVETLHAHGIVHGAIHDRNVIVDDRGAVTLTHVSPLLFCDAQKDWSAVDALFPGKRRQSLNDGKDVIRLRAVIGAGAAALVGLIVTASLLYFASTMP